MQTIVQGAVEAARVMNNAMAVVRIDNNNRAQNAVSMIGRPLIQQPTFNWEAKDKYSKLKTSYGR